MVIETKDQVLEKVLEMEKPRCPHCDQVMSIHGLAAAVNVS